MPCKEEKLSDEQNHSHIFHTQTLHTAHTQTHSFNLFESCTMLKMVVPSNDAIIVNACLNTFVHSIGCFSLPYCNVLCIQISSLSSLGFLLYSAHFYAETLFSCNIKSARIFYFDSRLLLVEFGGIICSSCLMFFWCCTKKNLFIFVVCMLSFGSLEALKFLTWWSRFAEKSAACISFYQSIVKVYTHTQNTYI